jgi:Family of unknown function (DUF6152)
MSSKICGAIALVAMLALSAPVVAHHAMQAEFDQNNVVVITGVLKKINWVNPHVNFLVDVKEPDGATTTWTLVHAGPNQMRAAGLSDRDFWQLGKTYMASLALARNGSPRGYVFTIKTPDEKFIYLTFGNVGVDPLNKDGKGGLGNGRPTKFQ